MKVCFAVRFGCTLGSSVLVLFFIAGLFAYEATTLQVAAQETVFTYQGRLQDSQTPAHGVFDFRFAIYDQALAGNLLASPLTNSSTAVANGLFVTSLDFGSGVFNGQPRWLEIGVRTNGSAAAYTILAPRQSITAVPYAVLAQTASNLLGVISAAQVSGTLNVNQLPAAVVTNYCTAVSLSGTFAGRSSTLVVTQLTGMTLTSDSVSAGSLTSSNVALTLPNSQSIATVSHNPNYPQGNEMWIRLAAAPTNNYNGVYSGIMWENGGSYPKGAAMYLNYAHGQSNGSAPELIIASSGRIAIGAGQLAGTDSRFIQMGIGNSQIVYMQQDGQRATNDAAVGNSMPLQLRAYFVTNGNQYAVGSGLPGGSEAQPCILSFASSNIGVGEIQFYDFVDVSGGNGARNNFTNSSLRAAIGIGPQATNGYFRVRGSIIAAGPNPYIFGDLSRATNIAASSLATTNAPAAGKALMVNQNGQLYWGP